MPVFFTVLLIVLALIVLLTLIVSFLLSSIVVRPKTHTDRECRDWEKRFQVDLSGFDGGWAREDFVLPSFDGCKLSGSFFPAAPGLSFPDGRPRAVVVVHGYTASRITAVKYAAIFRAHGFSCVLYDNRNHGLSDRTPTTMGLRETKDLAAVCEWTRQKLGDDVVLGTHGESMGAATVMLHAPTDDRLAFVIEDCGYDDLPEELAHGMKAQYRLPRFPFLAIASLFSRLRGGVFFGRVRPARALAACSASLPMLFIHGEQDDFVPFAMLEKVYRAKPGKKQKHTFENAGHAESCFKNPAAYAAEVTAFLRENGIIPADA